MSVATVDMGDEGAQVLIGKIVKVDVQGMSGYLHNIKLSVIMNQNHTGLSYMSYLTTDNAWSDDHVITACAGNFGAPCNLAAHRSIKTGGDTDTEILGEFGPVYLWLEISDPGVSAEEIRYVAETWGSFIKYQEQNSE